MLDTYAAYSEAFALLGTTCPCEALRIVTKGLVRTPVDQPDVVDHWVQLGSRVTAILSAMTVH